MGKTYIETLIEKSLPIKPIKENENKIFVGNFGCPRCEKIFPWEPKDNYKYKGCPTCLQAIEFPKKEKK